MINKKADNDNLKKQLVSAVNFKRKRTRIKEKGQKGGIVGALSSFGALGWTLTVPVILMLIIGKVVVEKFGLKESWIINFVFFGFAIGIYNSYKEIKKEYKKNLKITSENGKKEEKK
jgi:predicted F0F1-ATPase subunit